MALNIVSNYAANVAHRYLSKADAGASSSLAKLSAGSRVISAKDDAASLAIGSRLNAEVQAQKQAQVNAIQASSMLQIADGAMAKVNDILVRMKTLAVQAGSGQLSTTERSMLDTEYQALLSEIDRIADVTKFNGVTLVDGSTTTDTSVNAQGTNSDVQAADGFQSIVLGNTVGDAILSITFDAASDVLTVTNLSTGESQGVDIGSTAIATNAEQVVNFDELDVTITLNSAFDKTADISSASTAAAVASGTGSVISNSFLVTSATDSTAGAIAALSTQTLTVNSTSATAATFTLGAFTGSADISTAGSKTVTMSNGSSASFVVAFDVGVAFGSNATQTATANVNALGGLVFGEEGTSDTTSFTFKLGTGTTDGVDDVTISVTAISGEALNINGTLVTTEANADTASTALTTAIDTLNTARATVGAAQNRLEFASDNLATTIENTEAARSSLLDLDVAKEMTMFTSKQILVQSGVSMLAQANQMPQSLLKLFQ